MKGFRCLRGEPLVLSWMYLKRFFVQMSGRFGRFYCNKLGRETDRNMQTVLIWDLATAWVTKPLLSLELMLE